MTDSDEATLVISGSLFDEGEWAAQQMRREATHRPAQVAQMLAFAHGLNEAIDRGQWVDQSDAAGHFGLSRARISQLLRLTYLAPDIQETILHLEAIDGLEPMSGRAVLAISRSISWVEQRAQWIQLMEEISEIESALVHQKSVPSGQLEVIV